MPATEPIKKPEPKKIELLDLRSITRKSDVTQTRIVLIDDTGVENNRIEWILAGMCDLREPDRQGLSNLSARLTEGVTDMEHDSGYAFSLDLIGLKFESVHYHIAHFSAYVPARMPYGGFRVPNRGYDPVKDPEAEKCNGKGYCKLGRPHIITKFLPDENAALFRRVYGRRVEITIGPNPKKIDVVGG